MTDLIENVKSALDDLGIRWREAGQSLVIQSCPTCGNESFKVHLRLAHEGKVLLGRCYSGGCQENYSSLKYLKMQGMDDDKARMVHGMDPTGSLNGLSPNVDDLMKLVVDNTPKPVEQEQVVDITSFFKISDWLDHPVSQYAIGRGVDPNKHPVYINHQASSVVFVVRDGDKIVGYQERFVRPVNPHMKVKASPGFEKSKHILTFPNDGKIVVCEGPFTAIAAHNYGYYAVCTFGASVSDVQISKITNLATSLGRPVGVAFDLDGAGQKGFDRIRSALWWLQLDAFRVKVVSDTTLKQGYDLADAWKDGKSVQEVVDKWGGPSIPNVPIEDILL